MNAMSSLSTSRSLYSKRNVLIASVVLCVSSTQLVARADDASWGDIGSSPRNGSSASQLAANDEWRDIGTKPDARNKNWAAITERRGDFTSTLQPVSGTSLTGVRVSGNEKPEVVPSIVEYGIKGSAANSQLLPNAKDQENNVKKVNVDMFVGELKVMGKVNVTRVAIGNGAIIRAEILKSGELLVIAQSAGSTSLRLWNKDGTQSSYNIRVNQQDMETRVRLERMVRMRVRMVEFRKSAVGQLGIDWGSSANGPTFATAGDVIGNNLYRPAVEGFDGLPNRVQPFSTYFGIASNIKSKINFLSRNGDAVTLAEPVLSAINGGTASFLAGGEIPYPTTGENGQAVVDFKEYGIKLNVAPEIDNAGNVRTFVETEISQLDAASAVNGVPGLLTRRAQTQFNVKSGETIVISGLLNAESGNDVSFIPGIGKLPIIGKFFSSKNRRNSVTELVIFVTPEVVEPGDSGNTDRENRRYNSTSNRLRQARQQLPLME